MIVAGLCGWFHGFTAIPNTYIFLLQDIIPLIFVIRYYSHLPIDQNRNILFRNISFHFQKRRDGVKEKKKLILCIFFFGLVGLGKSSPGDLRSIDGVSLHRQSRRSA